MKKALIRLLSFSFILVILATPLSAFAKTNYYVDTESITKNVKMLGSEIISKGTLQDSERCYKKSIEVDDGGVKKTYDYRICYSASESKLCFKTSYDNEKDYVFIDYKNAPKMSVRVGVCSGASYAVAKASFDAFDYYENEDCTFTVESVEGELSKSYINSLANMNLRDSIQGYKECLKAYGSKYDMGKIGFVELCKHSFKVSYIPATTSNNGMKIENCKGCAFVKVSDYAPIGKIYLKKTVYSYNGSAKKPAVVVLDKNGKTIDSSNYTVTYQSGRKKLGKYWVNVKFNGVKYKGEKKLYFTIGPKNTSISSLTTKNKSFTAKWKKQTSNSTGYQLQYANDSGFTKNVYNVNISNNKTTRKTVSKLKAKKKYYVRIRTYKKINGTKYYSNWSDYKSITVKK